MRSSNPQSEIVQASQYSTEHPGSYQTVNGKMYFFPAVIQAPFGGYNSQNSSSPYPMDWQFQSQAKSGAAPSQAQLYYTNNLQNNANNAMKPKVASFKPQNYGDLAVHFSDPRLNQETSIEFEPSTVRDSSGFNYPSLRLDQYTNPGQNYLTQQQQMTPAYPIVPQNPYMTLQQKPLPAKPNPVYFPPPVMTPPKMVPYEKDIIHYVPKVQTKYVEQEVFVPGPEKNYVSQPFNADTYKIVPKYKDVEVKFVVSEAVVPEIEESSDLIEVEVNKYEPEIQYVDIYVPRPIAIPIKATGDYETYEKKSSKITQDHFQKSLEGINPHLAELESYNTANEQFFKGYVGQAQEIAQLYNISAPAPIYDVKEEVQKKKKGEIKNQLGKNDTQETIPVSHVSKEPLEEEEPQIEPEQINYEADHHSDSDSEKQFDQYEAQQEYEPEYNEDNYQNDDYEQVDDTNYQSNSNQYTPNNDDYAQTYQSNNYEERDDDDDSSSDEEREKTYDTDSSEKRSAIPVGN